MAEGVRGILKLGEEVVDREELEKKAKTAVAAASDMAIKGMEWVRNYRDAHREVPATRPCRNRR